MNNARIVRISKFLSKYLRHEPECLSLQLAPGGWVAVDALLSACSRNRFPISRAELEELVKQNDKQRYSFDATGTQIRANQGHSVEVDLELESAIPPAVLYHGTGHGSVEAIRLTGLRKMSRHHVHLSDNLETATKVGARHGQPVVFAINTAAMRRAGFTFFVSANGVWLVDQVPPDYLRILDPSSPPAPSQEKTQP